VGLRVGVAFLAVDVRDLIGALAVLLAVDFLVTVAMCGASLKIEKTVYIVIFLGASTERLL
jgi:hypothetical protein